MGKPDFKTMMMSFGLVVLLILQYQNCSTYADPSPFELGSAGVGASDSSPSQVKLDSPVGVLDMSELDLMLSIGGECNTGLAQKHYIEIKIFDTANTPIAVREDSLCPEKGVGLPADCFRATQFRCEHGRYNLVLPMNCGAYRGQSQSTYRLVGQLVTVDDNGKETRDTKAAFDRFFQVAWAPGACNN